MPYVWNCRLSWKDGYSTQRHTCTLQHVLASWTRGYFAKYDFYDFGIYNLHDNVMSPSFYVSCSEKEMWFYMIIWPMKFTWQYLYMSPSFHTVVVEKRHMAYRWHLVISIGRFLETSKHRIDLTSNHQNIILYDGSTTEVGWQLHHMKGSMFKGDSILEISLIQNSAMIENNNDYSTKDVWATLVKKKKKYITLTNEFC